MIGKHGDGNEERRDNADVNDIKILIVEDDPGLLSQLRWGLSDYKSLTAEDRVGGLAIFDLEKPQIVILDLGLPPHPNDASEGLAFLEAVLSQYPETKIIVVSGNQNRDIGPRVISLGAYSFCPKPVDLKALKSTIREALNTRAMADN